jgi:hypothetical protein
MALSPAASLAVNSHMAYARTFANQPSKLRYQTALSCERSSLPAVSGGFPPRRRPAHDARRSCPWFETAYKHSRLRQPLRPAVPWDLLNQIGDSRPKWKACAIDIAFRACDSSHRFLCQCVRVCYLCSGYSPRLTDRLSWNCFPKDLGTKSHQSDSIN